MYHLLGIRREDKNPWERRVPLIPSHARELSREHGLNIRIQPSKIRVFTDEDYCRQGIMVEEDLSPCKVIFAVKEIPLNFFEREKVYLFFSHTIKGQPHNMPMLRRMKELGCTLIDYEKVVDEKGRRLLFFGREAGLAGMIDTLWAVGERLLREKIGTPLALIRQARHYISLSEATEEIKKAGWRIYEEGFPPQLVPFVCGFAGYGHVSGGAQEIFNLLPFEDISPQKLESFFKGKNYSAHRVYKVVFKEEHMVKPLSGDEEFSLEDYYLHPEKYTPVFESYLKYLTVLVNCIYWEPKYPRFVTKKFLKRLFSSDSSPRLRIIGDISCDIEGAVECTLKATDPAHPVFTYDPLQDRAVDGFQGRGVVVMAVDNLPAEIPLESSTNFSQALKPFVPLIARVDFDQDYESLNLPEPIKKAVILYRGKFTPPYEYMEKFLKGEV
ncbi:MAG: bifunctional lysine ketoglutarate reductase /saccharopine dehydrogenase family protein [Candidatus Aminicenantales bacterium]